MSTQIQRVGSSGRLALQFYSCRAESALAPNFRARSYPAKHAMYPPRRHDVSIRQKAGFAWSAQCQMGRLLRGRHLEDASCLMQGLAKVKRTNHSEAKASLPLVFGRHLYVDSTVVPFILLCPASPVHASDRRSSLSATGRTSRPS